MTIPPNLRTELPLLGLLALLWGSAYLFLKIAVTEITPVTLIALRVSGAALCLYLVLRWRGERLPKDWRTRRMLLTQAMFNSIVAWTIVAWGQQYVDASLSSVLNSTSPIFVFLFTAVVTRHETLTLRKLLGMIVGLCGVTMVVGVDALRGLGSQVAGQLACLIGAALYGCAAIYSKRFTHISAVATAAGTMIWASLVLVPLAVILEKPWTLSPSAKAIGATVVLSLFCTALALMIYFRLVRTIGSMGVASQAYLRAGIGVCLGLIVLGERISWPVAVGLVAAISGVALINWPTRKPRAVSNQTAIGGEEAANAR